MSLYTSAYTVAEIDDGLGLAYASMHSASRQAIINGGFSVNQRVKSGTVTLAAGAYGHDRWRAGASGCTYAFATSANVTTLTISAGSLQQAIEGINLYNGTYILSWTGTAQGKIGAGSFGASGVSGSVVGGSNLTIEFGTGTLANVQFNFGSIALPFMPKRFNEELSACLGYYRKSYDIGTAPYTNTIIGAKNKFVPSYNAVQGHDFDVPMRAVPTVTLISVAGTANKITSEDGSVDIGTSVTALNSSSTGFRLGIDSGGGFTAGKVYFYHYTADAEIY